MPDDRTDPSQIREFAASMAARALTAAENAHDPSAGLGLTDALIAYTDSLAGDHRALAGLWADSRRRGWQSTSTELRRTASALDVIAKDLANVAPTPPGLGPVEPTPAPESNLGPVPPPANEPLPEPELAGTPEIGADVAANLSGASDTLPDLIAEPEVSPVPQQQTADPFTDPGPYVPQASVPTGGRVFTFAELASPPAYRDGFPEHWSWSQLETLEDCGAKYRLQRLEGLPQVPQWALVGGNAFHAAVAEIERAAAHDLKIWRGTGERGFGVYDPDGVTSLWTRAFHAEIATQVAASGMAMTHWRASNKGREGYDWWRVEGADMLARYVAVRAGQHTHDNPSTRELLRLPATPTGSDASITELALECELTIQVDSLHIRAVLDQAWWVEHDAILIVELKTGARMPDDTAQLGLYAHAIRQRLFGPAYTGPGGPKIFGAVYDARRGTYTESVDLLARHPLDEYRYRFGAADAARRNAAYLPRRSSFCGGCSVRYACPVGGR